MDSIWRDDPVYLYCCFSTKYKQTHQNCHSCSRWIFSKYCTSAMTRQQPLKLGALTAVTIQAQRGFHSLSSQLWRLGCCCHGLSSQWSTTEHCFEVFPYWHLSDSLASSTAGASLVMPALLPFHSPEIFLFLMLRVWFGKAWNICVTVHIDASSCAWQYNYMPCQFVSCFNLKTKCSLAKQMSCKSR